MGQTRGGDEVTEVRRRAQRDAWVRTKAIETVQRLFRDVPSVARCIEVETRWEEILKDAFVGCYEQGREMESLNSANLS